MRIHQIFRNPEVTRPQTGFLEPFQLREYEHCRYPAEKGLHPTPEIKERAGFLYGRLLGVMSFSAACKECSFKAPTYA